MNILSFNPLDFQNIDKWTVLSTQLTISILQTGISNQHRIGNMALSRSPKEVTMGSTDGIWHRLCKWSDCIVSPIPLLQACFTLGVNQP